MHEIEVSITLKGLDVATLIRLLSSAQLGGETINVRPIKAAPAKEVEAEAKTAAEVKEKRKPGRPSKKKPEPEEDEADDEEGEDEEAETDSDSEDVAEEDEDSDSDESDDEAEKPSKDKKSKKITIDDLTTAFAEYTKDNGRDAAAKVLKKFDVKVIRKAPEEIWPKLIKALKA